MKPSILLLLAFLSITIAHGVTPTVAPLAGHHHHSTASPLVGHQHLAHRLVHKISATNQRLRHLESLRSHDLSANYAQIKSMLNELLVRLEKQRSIEQKIVTMAQKKANIASKLFYAAQTKMNAAQGIWLSAKHSLAHAQTSQAAALAHINNQMVLLNNIMTMLQNCQTNVAPLVGHHHHSTVGPLVGHHHHSLVGGALNGHHHHHSNAGPLAGHHHHTSIGPLSGHHHHTNVGPLSGHHHHSLVGGALAGHHHTTTGPLAGHHHLHVLESDPNVLGISHHNAYSHSPMIARRFKRPMISRLRRRRFGRFGRGIKSPFLGRTRRFGYPYRRRFGHRMLENDESEVLDQDDEILENEGLDYDSQSLEAQDLEEEGLDYGEVLENDNSPTILEADQESALLNDILQDSNSNFASSPNKFSEPSSGSGQAKTQSVKTENIIHVEENKV